MEVRKLLKKFILFFIMSFFPLMKSIWDATIHIIWGIAAMFLLGGLIAQYQPDTSAILSLQTTANFLIDEWAFFWWTFLILNLYSETKRMKNDNKNN